MHEIVLDVSNVHPLYSTKDLADSGAVALIARATEGSSGKNSTDPKLEYHRVKAERAGVAFGSYVFLHPGSKGSEADLYLKYAKPTTGDIQPIIDAETLDGGTFATAAARVESCARVLEEEGLDPILYASASFWQGLFKENPRLARLRVWEAQYPGKITRWLPALAQRRIKLLHGASVVMWQFTDSYAVNGRTYDASVLLAPLESLLIRAV